MEIGINSRVVMLDEKKADEAHFLIAGMCAVMIKEYKLGHEFVARQMELEYFALKELLYQIIEHDISSRILSYRGKSRNELASDLACVIYGIVHSCNELGFPVKDERYYEVKMDAEKEEAC